MALVLKTRRLIASQVRILSLPPKVKQGDRMKKTLAKLKSAKSQKIYPGLKLEEGEWVELDIRRSKVGLILIWSAEVVGFIVLALLFFTLSSGASEYAFIGINPSTKVFIDLIIFIMYFFLIISGMVGTVVYNGNRIFITNKRVIQQSMISLFAKSTNIIDLVSIEDVSYSRKTIFEYLFRLGTIRMSTVGDETTYTFKFVDTPKDELDKITHLVHVVKEEAKNS